MRLPDFIWLNGDKIYPDINKSLPIDILLDRATSFGDGVFETMLVKNSKILFLELHLNRLFEGIKLLELDYDIKQIKNELNLSLSHGRLAAEGSSLRVDKALAALKPPTPTGVVAISAPPTIMTSASPFFINLLAIPIL